MTASRPVQCCICSSQPDMLWWEDGKVFIPQLMFLTDIPTNDQKSRLLCFGCSSRPKTFYGSEETLHKVIWAVAEDIVEVPAYRVEGFRLGVVETVINWAGAELDIRTSAFRPPCRMYKHVPIPPYFEPTPDGKDKFKDIVTLQWKQLSLWNRGLWDNLNSVKTYDEAHMYLQNMGQLNRSEAAEKFSILQQMAAGIHWLLYNDDLQQQRKAGTAVPDIGKLRSDYLTMYAREASHPHEEHFFTDLPNGWEYQHWSPMCPWMGAEWVCSHNNECWTVASPDSWYIGRDRMGLREDHEPFLLMDAHSYACPTCGMVYKPKNCSPIRGHKVCKVLVIDKEKKIDVPHIVDQVSTHREQGHQAARRTNLLENKDDENRFIICGMEWNYDHTVTDQLITKIKAAYRHMVDNQVPLETNIQQLCKLSASASAYFHEFFRVETIEPATDLYVRSFNQPPNVANSRKYWYCWASDAEWYDPQNPSAEHLHLRWPGKLNAHDMQHAELTDDHLNPRSEKWPVKRTRRLSQQTRDRMHVVQQEDWALLFSHMIRAEVIMSRM